MSQDSTTSIAAECVRVEQADDLLKECDIADAKLDGIAGGHIRGNIAGKRLYDSGSVSVERFEG